MHFLILIAHFTQLVSVSCRNASSFSNEPSDFIVSSIDLFYLYCLAALAHLLFSELSLLLLLRLHLYPDCVLLLLLRRQPRFCVAAMFGSSARLCSTAALASSPRLCVAAGFSNMSSFSLLHHYSCGVCVLTQMVRYCGFNNDTPPSACSNVAQSLSASVR